MKKILIFVLCLMPFALMGQSSNVRMTITSDSVVHFSRGLKELKIAPSSAYFITASNASVKEKRIADVRCDGIADQVQINAALTAGYNVRLSTGQFNIAAPITASVNNITIQGSGRGSTILNLSASSNCSVITIDGNGWVIRDLYIDGNASVNTGGYPCGIRGVSVENVTIDNVEITDVTENGIFIRDACANWIINNVYIHDMNSCIYGTTEGGGFPTNVKITNSRFHNTTTDSQIHTIVPANTTLNWTIDNCNFTGTSGYIDVLWDGSDNCNVVNSTFHSGIQTGEVIHSALRYFKGASGTINNNTFLADTTGTGDTGVSVHCWGADNVIISNNCIGKRRGGGVLLESWGAGVYNTKNITIIGNMFYNSDVLDLNPTISLYVGTSFTLQNVNIIGNNFLDDRGANALIQYAIVGSGAGTIKNVNISDNVMEGILETGVTFVATTMSDFKISNNLFIDIPVGIRFTEGDDIQITGNKFVLCTTPIDVNDSDVVYPLIEGNTMRGCTNSGTYAGATNEIIGINVWHDGTYDNSPP